jgi:hypothetical protein
MNGEFTVGELTGSKTAERMTTLLLGTLTIDSAFLRDHPYTAGSYSQRPQPPIPGAGFCRGEQGAPEVGPPEATGG